MFDLDAPIIPGDSAAGLHIDQPIEDVLVNEKPKATVPLHGVIKYDFGPIHLWVANDAIVQIGVVAGYRGSLRSGIKIGSTLGEIQQAIGPVIEDEEDNLAIPGSRG